MTVHGKRNQVGRIVCLGMWPLGFLLVCLDLPSLDIYDLIFLLTLGVLATWSTITSSNWVRFSIAGILFAVIIISEFKLEPVSRYLVSHHPDRNKGFLEGVFAMVNAIRPYRVYIIVATLGLFSMSISCSKRVSSKY